MTVKKLINVIAGIKVMAVIAVVNRKGGVGKSTLSYNIAAEAIALGVPALAIDGDFEEGSLSSWAAAGKSLLRDFVLKPELESFEEYIEAAKNAASAVIIDCPPQNSDAAITAIISADIVIVPCGPSKLERRAAISTLKLIDLAAAELGERKKAFLVPYRLGNNNLSRLLPERLTDIGAKNGRFGVLDAIKQSSVVTAATERNLAVCELKGIAKADREMFRPLTQKILKKSGVKL